VAVARDAAKSLAGLGRTFNLADPRIKPKVFIISFAELAFYGIEMLSG